MLPDAIAAAYRIAHVFNGLEIPYLIGGSMASSVHGTPRSTQDVDFVAEIRLEQVDAIVAALEGDFYVDGEMIRDAIRRRSSFNVIQLATMVKVDVFSRGIGRWPDEEWSRREPADIWPDTGQQPVQVASPEDIILQKLRWYEAGGRVSDHQWTDVLGVMKVQGERLDIAYLRRWAADLGLADLLESALTDAGLRS